MKEIQLVVMMVNAALESPFVQCYHGGYRLVLANLWFIASMCAISFTDM